MKKNNKKGLSIGSVLVTLISCFLALTFIILVATGIGELKDAATSRGYTSPESSYLYNLNSGDFADLLRDTQNDCRPGASYSHDMAEYRALAYYFQAASLYKAYDALGDSELADFERTRMNNFSDRITDNRRSIDRINERLDIE